MAGRHRTAVDGEQGPRPTRPSRRRHTSKRNSGIGRQALAIPIVLAVLIVGTASAVAATTGVLGCLGSRTDLTVAAAPDIAPALEQIAKRFEDGKIGSDDDCVDVTVTAQEPHQVAAAIRGALPGDQSVELPDVWVPDSTLWLNAVRTDRSDQSRLGRPTSIAHSPVVIAMVRPLADRLRWEEAKLNWIDLIKKAGQGSVSDALQSDAALQLGLVDPTRSAASASGLVGLRNATAKAGADLILVGAMRALGANLANTERSLLDQLPRNAAEVADPSLRRLHAFPHSEQGVWRYNISNPAVPLASVYPADGAPQLDYPYVPLRSGEDDEDRQEAGGGFLRAVQTAQGRQILLASAFRTVTDEAGVALSPVHGARLQKPPAAYLVKARDVDRMWQIWGTVSLNARMLAVIDVSGSMLKVDPGTTRSRMELTRDGAAQGLGLLAASSEVGLWAFSTNLTATTDYATVLEVGRLGQAVGSATRRDIMLARLGGLNAKQGGATGLYDTALAAYRKMTASYTPKAFNSVVLFTDGRNEDPSSITLPALLAELRKLYNPKKPVNLYTIGFGGEVDAAALDAIAKTTGGGSTVTTDPLKIRDTFLSAIAKRVCGTQGCQADGP